MVPRLLSELRLDSPNANYPPPVASPVWPAGFPGRQVGGSATPPEAVGRKTGRGYDLRPGLGREEKQMSAIEANLDWRGELKFGASLQGCELVITPAKRDVDAGPSPMGLFLAALASCTAMDIIAILQKKRLAVQSFRVRIVGQRRETEHPKVFESIELVFSVRGSELPPKAVADAIRLSRDRYCSVAGMVKGPVITERYRIEDPQGQLVEEGAVD
jgi:putative redox protein